MDRTNGATALQELMDNICWTEGVKAYNAGKALADNPYDKRDWVEMAAWENGWSDAALVAWLES